MQPQAREKAEKEGFEVSIAKTSFKANTKALAENEGEGLAKVVSVHCMQKLHSKLMFLTFTSFMLTSVLFLLLQLIYRPDNGEILGVHIFGLHAADLIHEASNAIALGTRIQVRTHLSLTRCIICKQNSLAQFLFIQLMSFCCINF